MKIGEETICYQHHKAETILEKLLKDYKLDNDIIKITTIDVYDIEIETNFISFYKLVKSSCENHINSYNKVYESFEQMLSHLSEKYNTHFNELLYNKLLILSKEQEKDDQ